MADYTSNYNLKKPASSDFYNVADFNGNTDIIDTALNSKLEKDLSNISGGAVPIANGGTGATTANGARDNLGLGMGSVPTFASFELIAQFPLIDFHYNNSSSDFDTRIINDASRQLTLDADKINLKGNTEISRNYVAETSHTVANPNGSIQLTVNSNRGIYDKGNSKWVLLSAPNSTDWNFYGTATNAQKVKNKDAFIHLNEANNVDLLSYIENLSSDVVGSFMATNCTNTPNSTNWWLVSVIYNGGSEKVVLASADGYCYSNHRWGNAWRGWQKINTTGSGNCFVSSSEPSKAQNGDLWAW